MRKLILEFDLEENDDYGALAAVHSMRLAMTLSEIRERARTALKHGGDPLNALNDIKGMAALTLELLE